MSNEAGDMKLLGNFSKLIELVSINPDYSPANISLKTSALNAQKDAAAAAVTAIPTHEGPYITAMGNRMRGYDGLRPLVSRSTSMLKASGADKQTRDRAMSISRKISGQRKNPRPKPDPNADPNTPGSTASTTHSSSQQSYENVVGNFDDLVGLLATVPTYAPNEPELKVTGLRALAADLKTKNEAVNSTFAPVSAARGLRDQLLYSNDDGVVNTALLVKAYVRAAFGPSHQLFKQIKGLEFKRPKR
jgi:hypothetical protein